MKKKLIAVVWVLLLLWSMVPASAAGEFVVEQGVLLSYQGHASTVTVPRGVTVIGEEAFAWNDGVKRVTLPNGVLEIEAGAFANCIRLTQVTLPPSLESIGEQAFFGCNALETATLPVGLLEIGREAFDGCVALKNWSVPKTVTAVGAHFADASWTPPRKGDFQMVGDGILLGYLGNQTEIKVPKGVKTIGYGAFAHCEALRSVALPDSLRSVGDRAFDGCSSLTELLIPKTVTHIGLYAFGGREAAADHGAFIPWLAAQTQPLVTAGDGVLIRFNGPLGRVVLPDSVRAVAGGVFCEREKPAGAAALTEIVFPQNLRELGDFAFADCGSLKKVILPASLAKTGDGAFAYCGALEDLTLSGGLADIGKWAFLECGRLPFAALPNTVRRIGQGAFQNCWSLERMTIPAGVLRVGKLALATGGLQSLTVTDPITRFADTALCDKALLPDGMVQSAAKPLIYAPSGAGAQRMAAAAGLPCLALPKAVPSTHKIAVDGRNVALDVYLIEGNNYCKLRDLAQAVSKTAAQFNVTWDGPRSSVRLWDGVAYTSVGGELAKGDGRAKTAYLSAGAFYLDETPKRLTAYMIGGNNYVKLRDVARSVDFGVTWDGAAGLVTIDTDAPYVPEP